MDSIISQYGLENKVVETLKYCVVCLTDAFVIVQKSYHIIDKTFYKIAS